MAEIHLTGFVGQDPQTMTTQGGKTLTKFSVAWSESVKKNGQWDYTRTQWIDVLCFDKLGEAVAQNVRKKDRVTITGNIRPDEYFSKKKNMPVDTLTITAREVSKPVMIRKEQRDVDDRGFQKPRQNYSQEQSFGQEQTFGDFGGNAEPPF